MLLLLGSRNIVYWNRKNVVFSFVERKKSIWFDLVPPAETEAGGGGVAEEPGGLAVDPEPLVGRGPGPGTVRVHGLDRQTDILNLWGKELQRKPKTINIRVCMLLRLMAGKLKSVLAFSLFIWIIWESMHETKSQESHIPFIVPFTEPRHDYFFVP